MQAELNVVFADVPQSGHNPCSGPLFAMADPSSLMAGCFTYWSLYLSPCGSSCIHRPQDTMNVAGLAHCCEKQQRFNVTFRLETGNSLPLRG
jgi:hypothetical protein